MKTLNQERANYCIKEIKNFTGDKKKFKTNARKLASLVVANGLIPTLAFYKSKDEKKPVYNFVNKWVIEQSHMKNIFSNNSYNVQQKPDLLDLLVEKDFTVLRLTTMEVLELANWLRRIVDVELEDEDE